MIIRAMFLIILVAVITPVFIATLLQIILVIILMMVMLFVQLLPHLVKFNAIGNFLHKASLHHDCDDDDDACVYNYIDDGE